MKGFKQVMCAALCASVLAAGAAWADCQCDDGTVFRGGNGDCRDGSICRLLDPSEIQPMQAQEVKPMQAQEVKPMQAQEVKPMPSREAQASAAGSRARPHSGAASLCAALQKTHAHIDEYMYRCDDGSIQAHNDCPDGSMGHLFVPKSITCKKHDAKRPGRIALSEFIGGWRTWVPSGTWQTEDRVTGERTAHFGLGTAPVRDLVINANGTYTWKGTRGKWRETADDENPITLYNGPDGHDWQVAILEDWYGYLAVADASRPGIYYYGKR